jgi:hypothetical protein
MQLLLWRPPSWMQQRAELRSYGDGGALSVAGEVGLVFHDAKQLPRLAREAGESTNAQCTNGVVLTGSLSSAGVLGALGVGSSRRVGVEPAALVAHAPRGLEKASEGGRVVVAPPNRVEEDVSRRRAQSHVRDAAPQQRYG